MTEQTTPTSNDWACNVAIIGPSGSGKSTSIENLPDGKTLILNVENKKLPFKKKFKNQMRIQDYRQMLGNEQDPGYLVKAINSDKLDFIVIDSFTSWVEMLLKYSKKYKSGYDIYNHYNDEITHFMEAIKFQESKMIFLLGIPENVQGLEGLVERRMKVAGKQWEGMIEKEFPIVFYTKTRRNEQNQSEYFFETQTDGVTSAKSPKGMFDELLIPNDLFEVAKAIREYYK